MGWSSSIDKRASPAQPSLHACARFGWGVIIMLPASAYAAQPSPCGPARRWPLTTLSTMHLALRLSATFLPANIMLSHALFLVAEFKTAINESLTDENQARINVGMGASSCYCGEVK
jgi:hypothetical protein